MIFQIFSNKPKDDLNNRNRLKHMIFQIFSNKNSKTEFYSFTSSFGVGLVLTNMLALLFSFVTPTPGIGALTRIKVQNPDTLYSLMTDPKSLIFYFTLIAQTIVSSLMLFGFKFNKRGSTTYLSLPISRRRLFWSRYGAGLIAVILPNIFYMTYILIVNIWVFGASTQLTQAYLLILFGIITIILLVYSITTAVCMLVGTSPEALAFTIIILFYPAFMAIGMTSISQFLLFGNEFGVRTVFYDFLSPDLTYYATDYTPTIVLIKIFNTFGEFRYPVEYFLHLREDFWNGAGTLALWFTLSLAVSYLAYLAFRRYKAENSGILGINKPLNFICTFLIVFWAFCAACTSAIPDVGKILFALALSLVAFILCRFLLTLSIKKALSIKGIWQHLVIIFVICGLYAVGMFGYSSYIPDPSDVIGAKITYTGAPDFILGASGETGNYYRAGKSDTEQDVFIREFYNLGYSSEEDIRTVMELHKKIIDSGSGLFGSVKQTIDNIEKDRLKFQVHVAYGLSDGTTVINRLYKSVTADILMDMLKLDNTDIVKKRIAETIEILENYEDLKTVKVTDNLFGNEYTLDAADYKGLFAALRKDIENLTLDEKYFPDSMARAIISFPRISPAGSDSNPNPDETSIEGVDMNSDVVYYVNNNSVVTISGGFYDSTAHVFNGSTDNIRYFITEAYTNTLVFLEEKNLLGGVIEPIEMYVERYRINPEFITQTTYFRSYAAGKYKVHDGSLAIDESEYENILKLARSNYYVAGGGYLVKVNTGNSVANWVTLFLPEANAPEYLKELRLE